MAENPAFAARVQERIALYRARDRAPLAAPVGDGRCHRGDRRLDARRTPGSRSPSTAPRRRPQPYRGERRRRFPFVRQIDQMDCGAACVAMLCRGFGHDVSMTSIRYAVGTSTDGTTLRGLIRGGEEIGLAMRPIKSSPDRIDMLPLPAIVHWQGNHWIVLHRIDGDKLRVADPGRGLRTVTRAELEEKWSGYAALAAPTERLAQAPRGRA